MLVVGPLHNISHCTTSSPTRTSIEPQLMIIDWKILIFTIFNIIKKNTEIASYHLHITPHHGQYILGSSPTNTSDRSEGHQDRLITTWSEMLQLSIIYILATSNVPFESSSSLHCPEFWAIKSTDWLVSWITIIFLSYTTYSCPYVQNFGDQIRSGGVGETLSIVKQLCSSFKVIIIIILCWMDIDISVVLFSWSREYDDCTTQASAAATTTTMTI